MGRRAGPPLSERAARAAARPTTVPQLRSSAELLRMPLSGLHRVTGTRQGSRYGTVRNGFRSLVHTTGGQQRAGAGVCAGVSRTRRPSAARSGTARPGLRGRDCAAGRTPGGRARHRRTGPRLGQDRGGAWTGPGRGLDGSSLGGGVVLPGRLRAAAARPRPDGRSHHSAQDGGTPGSAAPAARGASGSAAARTASTAMSSSLMPPWRRTSSSNQLSNASGSRPRYTRSRSAGS